MTTELATARPGTHSTTRGASRGALALGPDQTEWTPQQIAALRQLGVEDAPEGDLDVFRHVCQATGLDPFRKQIYMIGRKTQVKYWDEQQKRQVAEWVMKYTIQTGIDGYRKNGRRAADRNGEKIRVDGPYWQGTDGGGWQDVWLADKPPAAAKFTIFRDGEAHVGIAMYREFIQTAPGTDAPNSMWKKMPANQLAKCAEAQAWRRAYPDDFSGVQLEDAVQIIEPDDAGPVRAHTERVSAAAITAASTPSEGPTVQQWQAPEPPSDPVEKPDTAQVDAPAPEADAEPRATAEQIKALGVALRGWDKKTRKAQLAYLTESMGREITDPAQLSAWECTTLTEHLVNAKPEETPAPESAPEGDADAQLPMDGAEGGE